MMLFVALVTAVFWICAIEDQTRRHNEMIDLIDRDFDQVDRLMEMMR